MTHSFEPGGLKQGNIQNMWYNGHIALGWSNTGKAMVLLLVIVVVQAAGLALAGMLLDLLKQNSPRISVALMTQYFL